MTQALTTHRLVFFKGERSADLHQRVGEEMMPECSFFFFFA